MRDAIVLGSLLGVSAMSVVLLADVEANGSIVVRLGGWHPELGIVLVADMFAVLVLAVAMITITLVEAFSVGQRRSSTGADPTVAAPMLMVLTSGVALSVLTGDLFTLFVAFELMLVASYVLLTHQGRAGQVRSGMTYVVINPVRVDALPLRRGVRVRRDRNRQPSGCSSERIPDLDTPSCGGGSDCGSSWCSARRRRCSPCSPGCRTAIPTAPTTITAVFAGLLTKIGVYVMIRFSTLMSMDDLGTVILVIAGFTMIVGVLGALAQDDMKRILSFHIVSQIGYMMMGLGLFSVAGVAGAIIFVVHQIPVKTVLFLVGAMVETDRKTSALSRLGGLVSSRPWLALAFALPALSLAGLPPFSGFVAKFALIDAGIDAGTVAIVVVGLVGSALTLLSMVKIWMGVFWGPENAPAFHARDSEEFVVRPSTSNGWSLMSAATGAAVALTLAIAVFSGPLWDMSERAATELLDGDVYATGVLGSDR